MFLLFRKKSPNTVSSGNQNSNTDRDRDSIIPEIRVEMHDPSVETPDPLVEAGFKPFTLDYISGASKKERIFLLCLEHAFDDTVPLPTLGQARSILPFIDGPQVNITECFITDFLKSVSSEPNLNRMVDFLKNSKKELLYNSLDSIPQSYYQCIPVSGGTSEVKYTFPSVLSRFVEPEIFDAFKEPVDHETLKMLIEVISSSRNEFIYITKAKELYKFLQRNSQRNLLLKLCCVI